MDNNHNNNNNGSQIMDHIIMDNGSQILQTFNWTFLLYVTRFSAIKSTLLIMAMYLFLDVENNSSNATHTYVTIVYFSSVYIHYQCMLFRSIDFVQIDIAC